MLYYFKIGLSFSEAICKIASSTFSSLCKTLVESADFSINMLLGEARHLKDETKATIDRGLRNKLMLFATDPCISHAFRGRRELANCFHWGHLNEYNIFLRIPVDKIEQWGGAINLIYTQLIHHLEQRPERYSLAGRGNSQILLMMDEFARLGKLEPITAAMATLRSKNVNICLIVQSVAQLDKFYGEHDRRIILANYISGRRLHDSYNDRTYYRRRQDVLYCKVHQPAHAPPDYFDLQRLCNEIDRAEKRYDARTAREFKGFLPNELPLHEQIRIVREYIDINFIQQGLCAVAAIHEGKNRTDPSKDNPHVHIIVPTRTVGPDGPRHSSPPGPGIQLRSFLT